MSIVTIDYPGDTNPRPLEKYYVEGDYDVIANSPIIMSYGPAGTVLECISLTEFEQKFPEQKDSCPNWRLRLCKIRVNNKNEITCISVNCDKKCVLCSIEGVIRCSCE